MKAATWTAGSRESSLLPDGTNLKRALIAAKLHYIDSGWRFGKFGSLGTFCSCIRATGT
jgi:hypothetical protein